MSSFMLLSQSDDRVIHSTKTRQSEQRSAGISVTRTSTNDTESRIVSVSQPNLTVSVQV